MIAGDYICMLNPDINQQIRVLQIKDLYSRVRHWSDFNIYELYRMQNQTMNSERVEEAEGTIQYRPPSIIDFNKYLRDPDIKDLNLSMAPISTHLSQRSQDNLDYASDEAINLNLLQLTIGNRAIVIDLQKEHSVKKTSSKEAQFPVIKDFSDMQQLIDPQKFVCSEVNIQNCYSDEKVCSGATYHFTDFININKSQDFFIVGAKWRFVASPESTDEISEHILPPRFLGGYKTYSESDIMSLKRVKEELELRRPLANLDLQCLLSTYLGQTAFSMQEQNILFQTIENVLKNADIEPDLDQDEHEIESHIFRRLFQILMTPIPILMHKKADNQKLETDEMTQMYDN